MHPNLTRENNYNYIIILYKVKLPAAGFALGPAQISSYSDIVRYIIANGRLAPVLRA
jgi:hypothetical protein